MKTQFKNMAIISAVLLTTTAIPAVAMLETGGYNREFHTMGMMKAIDANGDHVVTHDEYINYYKIVFDELDTNHNDFIDGKEWIGLKGEQEISVSTGSYSRALRTNEMLEAKDTNHDGKVSKDEFFSYHEAYFKMIDKPGTGKIDAQNWLRRQTNN
ncbi:EF-hand domain-containing protein [Methylotenera sp.]|uniref:EF-hand domain-containing protein n=1 Tax=Methylotenera sp. TaxID=2051956 RepID=UPI0027370ECE|nr:calcium-binding protein [Methylotenera sp.]MDP3004665.1 calcium-binding protein [Methylotenera sp.]